MSGAIRPVGALPFRLRRTQRPSVTAEAVSASYDAGVLTVRVADAYAESGSQGGLSLRGRRMARARTPPWWPGPARLTAAAPHEPSVSSVASRGG
jgi:hypothetical protein